MQKMVVLDRFDVPVVFLSINEYDSHLRHLCALGLVGLIIASDIGQMTNASCTSSNRAPVSMAAG